MFRRALILVASLSIVLPSSAMAEPCVSPGNATATRMDTRNLETVVPILVHLGLWLGILTKRSFDDDLKQSRKACARAEFNAGAMTYTLRGDNDDAALARVAVTSSRKAPVGYLTPVADFTAALTPGHTGTAPISGYALITLSEGTHTVWRLYDRVPGDTVLLTDFSEAISGGAKPVMRWRGGRIEIVAP